MGYELVTNYADPLVVTPDPWLNHNFFIPKLGDESKLILTFSIF